MSVLQKVRMEDWNENFVETSMFQLIQWKVALEAELKGIAVVADASNPDSNTPVFDHLIKFLNAPKDHDFDVPAMYNYICQTMVSLHEVMYENPEELNKSLGITPLQVIKVIQESGFY